MLRSPPPPPRSKLGVFWGGRYGPVLTTNSAQDEANISGYRSPKEGGGGEGSEKRAPATSPARKLCFVHPKPLWHNNSPFNNNL